jgi:hypothetical protein
MYLWYLALINLGHPGSAGPPPSRARLLSEKDWKMKADYFPIVYISHTHTNKERIRLGIDHSHSAFSLGTGEEGFKVMWYMSKIKRDRSYFFYRQYMPFLV